jgi:hypothetical protein
MADQMNWLVSLAVLAFFVAVAVIQMVPSPLPSIARPLGCVGQDDAPRGESPECAALCPAGAAESGRLAGEPLPRGSGESEVAA